MPPPRPPPALTDDLVGEILLRFPPDDPASLVRAALVCKPWYRIVSDRSFPRRFREFHRTPPVLGLLCNCRDDPWAEGDTVEFVPIAAFPSRPAFQRYRRAIDARHGRVLFRGMLWLEDGDLRDDPFAVWDPVTREEWELPCLPRHPDTWNAAVLCAAAGCDHLDCHGRPFLVVVVDTEAAEMFVRVYSSEAGAWSEQPVPDPNMPANSLWPSVLAGNSLYFMLCPRTRILRYDLSTREITLIDLPRVAYKPDVLIATEDGRLGFAVVLKSRLHLWSREVGPERDARWTESRVIKLKNLLSGRALSASPTVVDFADGLDVVFIGTGAGVFSVDLESQRVTNVYDGKDCNVLPYMRFYTPALAYR